MATGVWQNDRWHGRQWNDFKRKEFFIDILGLDEGKYEDLRREVTTAVANTSNPDQDEVRDESLQVHNVPVDYLADLKRKWHTVVASRLPDNDISAFWTAFLQHESAQGSGSAAGLQTNTLEQPSTLQTSRTCTPVAHGDFVRSTGGVDDAAADSTRLSLHDDGRPATTLQPVLLPVLSSVRISVEVLQDAPHQNVLMVFGAWECVDRCDGQIKQPIDPLRLNFQRLRAAIDEMMAGRRLNPVDWSQFKLVTLSGAQDNSIVDGPSLRREFVDMCETCDSVRTWPLKIVKDDRGAGSARPTSDVGVAKTPDTDTAIPLRGRNRTQSVALPENDTLPPSARDRKRQLMSAPSDDNIDPDSGTRTKRRKKDGGLDAERPGADEDAGRDEDEFGFDGEGEPLADGEGNAVRDAQLALVGAEDRLQASIFEHASRKTEHWTRTTFEDTCTAAGLKPAKYGPTFRFAMEGVRPDTTLTFSQLHCATVMDAKISRIGGVILGNEMGLGKTRVVWACVRNRAWWNKLYEEVRRERLLAKSQGLDRPPRHLPRDAPAGAQCPSRRDRRPVGCVCEKDSRLAKHHPYQPGAVVVFALPRALKEWVDEFNKFFQDDAAGSYKNTGFQAGFDEPDENAPFRLIICHEDTMKMIPPAQRSQHELTNSEAQTLTSETKHGRIWPRIGSDRFVVITTDQSFNGQFARRVGKLGPSSFGPEKSISQGDSVRNIDDFMPGMIIVDEFHMHASLDSGAPAQVRKTAFRSLQSVSGEKLPKNSKVKRGTTHLDLPTYAPSLVLISGTPFPDNMYHVGKVWVTIMQGLCEARSYFSSRGHGITRWDQEPSLRHLGGKVCAEMFKKVGDYIAKPDKVDSRAVAEIITHAREYMADLMIRHTSKTMLFNEPISMLPPMTREYIACDASSAVQRKINDKLSALASKAWVTFSGQVEKGSRPQTRVQQGSDFVTKVAKQVSTRPSLKLLSIFPGVFDAAAEYNKANTVAGAVNEAPALRFTAEELCLHKWDSDNVEESPYFKHLDLILKDSPKLPKIVEFLRLVASTKSDFYTVTDQSGRTSAADAQALCFTSSPVAALIVDLFLRYRVNHKDYPQYSIDRPLYPVLFTASHNSGSRRKRLISIFNGQGDPKEARVRGKDEVALPDRIDWITTTTGCCGVGENIPRAKFVLLPSGKHLEDQVLARAVRAGDKEKKIGHILHTNGAKTEQLQLEINMNGERLKSQTLDDWQTFLGIDMAKDKPEAGRTRE